MLCMYLYIFRAPQYDTACIIFIFLLISGAWSAATASLLDPSLPRPTSVASCWVVLYFATCPPLTRFPLMRIPLTRFFFHIFQWGLVCDREFVGPLITTTYFCGVMLGGIIFGSFSDKFGRKNIMLIW